MAVGSSAGHGNKSRKHEERGSEENRLQWTHTEREERPNPYADDDDVSKFDLFLSAVK